MESMGTRVSSRGDTGLSENRERTPQSMASLMGKMRFSNRWISGYGYAIFRKIHTPICINLWPGNNWGRSYIINNMGMDQYLLIPFLVGWTSISQLFWCSPGVQGFDTLPYSIHVYNGVSVCRSDSLPLLTIYEWVKILGSQFLWSQDIHLEHAWSLPVTFLGCKSHVFFFGFKWYFNTIWIPLSILFYPFPISERVRAFRGAFLWNPRTSAGSSAGSFWGCHQPVVSGDYQGVEQAKNMGFGLSYKKEKGI